MKPITSSGLPSIESDSKDVHGALDAGKPESISVCNPDDGSTLFSEGITYDIPIYQRSYAWEYRQIEQLIDDINDSDSPFYFLGSLVVDNKKDDRQIYEVIDGQQRLATLFILFSVLNELRGEEKGFRQFKLGERSLRYDCRRRSDTTIELMRAWSDDKLQHVDLEESLLAGRKNVKDILTQKANQNTEEAIDLCRFTRRLSCVRMFRIVVPDYTDLNRYFEIMNTRGEQLASHDILKARLVKCLSSKDDQHSFDEIWKACSDMSGYVQMHFKKEVRNLLFNPSNEMKNEEDRWNGIPNDPIKALSDSSDKITPKSTETLTIDEILMDKESEQDVQGENKVDDDSSFQSIIEFPVFLLHVLRVYVSDPSRGFDTEINLGELLDDNKLLDEYEQVMGKMAENQQSETFVRDFAACLLRCRRLFDDYIIKRRTTTRNYDGEWSLMQLSASNQDKPYYKLTTFGSLKPNGTLQGNSEYEALMLQSALRVSYTSPRVMHWITSLLVKLSDDDFRKCHLSEYGKLVEQETQKGVIPYLEAGDFYQGLGTPRIVFNYLDFLLWREDKDRFDDFSFEFRNSVEHFYPQHPSEGMFEPWTKRKDEDEDSPMLRDGIGNLCLVTIRANSKFSNLSPESKMESFSDMISTGSIKLRKMCDLIKANASDGSKNGSKKWRESACEKHGSEMIDKLREACKMGDE